MKRTIPMQSFRVDGVSVNEGAEGITLVVPPEGGKLILHGAPMTMGGLDWSGMKYLVLDVTALDPYDQAFTFVFMTPQQMTGPLCILNAGILPQLRVCLPINLGVLDSQNMFAERTPGRLKMIALGRGISLDEACVMILTFKKTNYTQHILLHDLYLTDEEPSCVIDAAPIVDELGQFKNKTWQGKTESVEELCAYLRGAADAADPDAPMPGRSRYGGDLSVRYEGTGYFRTHFDGKRWFLVDPDGYRFLSTGLDCCTLGDGGNVTGIECLLEPTPTEERYAEAYRNDFHPEYHYCNHNLINLIRAFGDDSWNQWAKLTKARLKEWGFTTIGNWSNAQFCKTAHFPYVWPLDDFPTTKALIFRDFPDVFAPEYQENSEKFAEQLRPFAGDDCLIGYFLRNEPEWAFVNKLLIADKVLENPEDTASKREFIRFLQEKYEDISALNEAWGRSYGSFDDLLEKQPPISTFGEASAEDSRAFSKVMIRRYVSIPSESCRKVDAQHLNLGMRYAQLTDPILLEGYENFDVFSINGYDANIYPLVQEAGELTGKPVMVGEFHFGATDSGMLCAGICSVATQKDRGLAYRAYYENAMNSPYFVGAHYFSLNDQPVLGRFDGENMNIGLVDVCGKPYNEMVGEVTKVNFEIYEIADGKRTPEIPVQRVPRMMGF